MRRKLAFLLTLWWMILCGSLGACLLLFAPREAVVSEAENRTLAAFPKLTLETIRNGSYSEAFEEFLCDKFFLRTWAVDAANAVEHAFSALTVDELMGDATAEDPTIPTLTDEKNEPKDSESAQDVPQPSAPTEPNETEQAEPPEPARSELESAPVSVSTPATATVWLLGKDGTKTALLTYERADIERAANVFNSYASLLPKDGTLHVLLAPRAQTANRLALHLDTESGWSSDLESALKPLVRSNVKVHSLVDLLLPHILNGEYIYYRTDHHWTALGAYYAANELIGGEGYPLVPLDAYEKASIENFLGSVYLHGRSAKLKDLADTLDYYEPILPAKSFRVSNTYRKGELPVIDETQTDYKVFLGGTQGPYRVLDGGYHTGRNLLVICDSFGNALAPFLMPYYDSVYMVDFRNEYYSKEGAQGGVAEYVRRCSITDILVVLSESDGVGTAYVNNLMPENLK